MSVMKVAESMRDNGDRTRASVPRVALRSVIQRGPGRAEEGTPCHGDQHVAAAYGGEGETEELDEGGAEIELPAEHGGGPAVVDDVAGGGEGCAIRM